MPSYKYSNFYQFKNIHFKVTKLFLIGTFCIMEKVIMNDY